MQNTENALLLPLAPLWGLSKEHTKMQILIKSIPSYICFLIVNWKVRNLNHVYHAKCDLYAHPTFSFLCFTVKHLNDLSMEYQRKSCHVRFFTLKREFSRLQFQRHRSLHQYVKIAEPYPDNSQCQALETLLASHITELLKAQTSEENPGMKIKSAE
ncbi:hypothetical protein VNO80_21682 [Phaseolus coccineus]|uniref:Uncharacterized protein n=1 Tax=Phaseolus coccineus TaxID=3886 RepID=A0AAN9M2V2_PHACN